MERASVVKSLLPCNGTLPLHSLSMATGIAISRLVPGADTEANLLALEAALYAERARIKLALDNAAMIAAMVFAQPLITEWAPCWRYAYTIALSLGVKYTSEGFFLEDMLRLTQEFPYESLVEGEIMAHMLHVADNELPSMSARILSFRTALLNVALEQMLLPTPPTLSLAHQQDNQVDGDVPLHVLVVDGSPEICASHSQRVLEVDPSARVSFCQSTRAALEYVAACEAEGDQIDLLLLDPEIELVAEYAEELDSDAPPTGGFHLVNALWAPHADGVPMPIDFRFTPLIALVASAADPLLVESSLSADGSFRGCDCVLQKPVNTEAMRVLVEGCRL